MSWHGIGLIAGSQQNLPSLSGFPQPPQSLMPGANWQGTAGSGFATIPVDPTRATAKPALRLITPPFQWFTDTLDVGVIAAANDGGTLRNNLGIAHVTFHFEGRSVAVEAPRWHTIPTQRGPRTYFGWWVRLRKPTSQAGHGHLYVEATARDPSMQPRVIGPLTFSPQSQLHDATLTIAPSQSVVTGQRYQSLAAAIGWCKTNNRINPLITITEPGIYQPGTSAGETYSAPGYYNITANVPGVTIGRREDEIVAGVNNINNDRGKLHLFGPHLTLDFRFAINLAQLASSPPSVSQLSHWLDGITVTNSDPRGRNADYWGGGLPRSVATARLMLGSPWATEITLSHLSNAMIGFQLIRGCEASSLVADVANAAGCIVQSRFDDLSGRFWSDDRPAFSVHYTGNEATATIARSGGVVGGGGGVWTVTLGATSYTFSTGTPAPPRDGFFFADLVAWLNTLPDVSATLLIEPFDRGASSGSLPGRVGQGFGATDFKAASLTIVSNCDLHCDWYQHQAGGTLRNTIIAFNEVLNMDAQIIFLSPPTPAPRDEEDVLIFGNIFHAPALGAGGSQWGRPNLPLNAKHVVLAHNTFVNQRMLLRNEGGGLNTDAYCLMKNNVMPELSVLGTSPVPNLTIDGLHVQTGNPPGAVNVSAGGSNASLLGDAAAFDFSPAGALLENLQTAALPSDLNRALFSESAPNGALAE